MRFCTCQACRHRAWLATLAVWHLTWAFDLLTKPAHVHSRAAPACSIMLGAWRRMMRRQSCDKIIAHHQEQMLPSYTTNASEACSPLPVVLTMRKKMACHKTPPMAPPALTRPQTTPLERLLTNGTTPYTVPQVICTVQTCQHMKLL